VTSISETIAREMEIDGLPIGVSVLLPGPVETRVMESERGRPAGRGVEQRTELTEAVRLEIRGLFAGPTGQQPEQVATRVLEAIRGSEFWILAHGSERETIETRFATVLDSFPAGPARDETAANRRRP
jgi:NAD(P)-dependent dehydrogenase (short-subunit alcohol dehydrogenase family)